MRTPIIAGNWKMNKTISEGVELVNKIKDVAAKTDVEVVVCVPFVSLDAIKKELEGTEVKLGAQNMHWEESGAFTGEISPLMLKEIGIDYVVIGHSERRQYFNETDETVNKKIKAAIAHGINPIVCVGETLEQRENGEEKEVVNEQVLKALEDVEAEDVKKVVIAYEPIWAIGTGKTASSEDANEMIEYIRSTIEGKYGVDISEEVRIQYGGSVKPKNVTDIMNQPDIDGALVGGASLKAEDFTDIVNF
ncbi:triose-phosphate isomerase [Caldisalinibacter kiritimatiensis]|uniref:Triosephosphate isomerase n=1 Tax=Caldisalinibacter kiritimatiensis TaxID=1304284 RepID=R1CQ06_9FIRM|nr:triose-phosphate isomerase [Caldisalinibacter kiritimatiensis]EOD00766.1 Triosephosphate isomerase [Caldisalinibacter kiritimatiensis]